MIKSLWIFLIFICTFADVSGTMDDEDPDSIRAPLTGSPDALRRVSGYGASSSSSGSSSAVSSPSIPRSGGMGEGISEIQEPIAFARSAQHPESDDKIALENYANSTVFNFDDPLGLKISRWIGKVVGVMAAQGSDPLTIFMFFNMILLLSRYDVPVNSSLDWAVIAITTALLTPATSELMGEAFEKTASQAYRLKNVPLIKHFPGIQRIRTPLEIPQAYKLPRSIVPKIVNGVYAGALGLLYMGVLSRLEHKDSVRWFFWVFGLPYGAFNFWKSYRHQNDHPTGLVEERQGFQNYQLILYNICRQKVENTQQELRYKDDEDIYEIYRTITSKRSTFHDKMRSLFPPRLQLRRMNIHGDIEQDSRKDLTINDLTPSSKLKKFAEHLSYLRSYGASAARLLFFAGFLEYALEAVGIPAGLGRKIPQYMGAILLDFAATILEMDSGEAFFNSIFQKRFASTYSASNPIMRRIIGVIGLPVGLILSMSDSWLFWHLATSLPPVGEGPLNHIRDDIRFPLLGFMIYDRLPPNASFITDGYDRFFSSVRDILRQLSSWISRGRIASQGRGYREDQISFALKRLNGLLDNLNDESIEIAHGWIIGNHSRDLLRQPVTIPRVSFSPQQIQNLRQRLNSEGQAALDRMLLDPS